MKYLYYICGVTVAFQIGVRLHSKDPRIEADNAGWGDVHDGNDSHCN